MCKGLVVSTGRCGVHGANGEHGAVRGGEMSAGRYGEQGGGKVRRGYDKEWVGRSLRDLHLVRVCRVDDICDLTVLEVARVGLAEVVGEVEDTVVGLTQRRLVGGRKRCAPEVVDHDL